MKIHISLSARLVKHLQHQPNQSKSNLSRQAPLSQQEADEKVISQQANQTLWLFHNRQDQTLWLFFMLFRWLFHSALNLNVATQRMGNGNTVLQTIPQQPQNNYPLVRFRCLNVKMTREFGWDGITRGQESYPTSPIPPSYLVVWFVLFVINQCHRHIWLFSVLPKEVDILVQVHWQQCWPLMCFNLLKVVVASDSGKYQHQRLLIPSLLF